MRLRPCILVLCLLLLLPEEATAQTNETVKGRWSGRLDAATGYGRSLVREESSREITDTLNHLREQVGLNLNYSSPRFSYSMDAQCQFEKNDNRYTRFGVKDQSQIEANYREGSRRQPGGSLRSDFLWRPDTRNQYTAFTSWQYGQDHVSNGSSLLFVEGKEETGYLHVIIEERYETTHGATAGWRSSHQLGASGRRSLHTAIDWRGTFRDKYSEWSDAHYTTEHYQSDYTYRLTPDTDIHDITTSVTYRDSLLTGDHTLTMEPYVRARTLYNRDAYSGAVLMGESDLWRDSLKLRETYHYLTLQLDPALRIEYRHAPVRIVSDYSLQFYGQQLNTEELHKKAFHYQDLSWQAPLVIGRTFLEWMPFAGHLLVLGNTISVSRPGYLQICDYERQGADPAQLFRGNPQLLPTRAISTDLTWRFRFKRFQINTFTNYTFRLNEVEQVFWDETVDDKDYRIFTWLNTAYGRTFNQNMRISWNGTVFSTNLQVNYQQKKQVALISEKENKSNYWELMAEATVRPGAGWRIAANGTYRGDIKTLYSLTHQYYTVNASVEKDFGKIRVFLEGRDLFDKPVKTEFFSPDFTDCWQEESWLNRRLFLLGLSWRF